MKRSGFGGDRPFPPGTTGPGRQVQGHGFSLGERSERQGGGGEALQPQEEHRVAMKWPLRGVPPASAVLGVRLLLVASQGNCHRQDGVLGCRSP